MSCEEGGACVIGSSYVPRRSDGSAPAATQPSGCGMTGPSGCAGCSAIHSAAPSGRIDPAVCPCKAKGPTRHASVLGGDPGMTPPDRPASTFIPPPVRRDDKRPRLAPPALPPSREVPMDGPSSAFVPPAPPRKMPDGGSVKVPMPTPTTLLVRDPSKDPAPPMVVTTLVPLPTALQPLPGRPYCADARLAGTELCAGAPVSDECARILGAWLAANPGTPIAAFLASSSAMGELCAGEFVRLLAPAGTKASAGFYDAPGYGNPFGPDGYAWKQDRVRKPAPFSYRGDGSTMDWRKPSGALGVAPKWNAHVRIVNMPHGGQVYVNGIPVSGHWEDDALTRWAVMAPAGMVDVQVVRAGDRGATLSQSVLASPYGVAQLTYDYAPSKGSQSSAPSGALPNYHRAPYGFRPSGDVATAADWTHGGPADLGSGGYIATASDWGTNPNALVDPGHGSGAYNGASSWTLGGPATDIVPPAPATPPVDYGALITGIGSAVGASLAGIGTIVNQANQNRLRELEIEYANNARGAQLALQRATMEAQTEIQRLAAQNTPAANAAVQALQQQVADMSVRLQQPPASEWTTGEKLGAAAAGVAVLGFAAWLATRRG